MSTAAILLTLGACVVGGGVVGIVADVRGWSQDRALTTSVVIGVGIVVVFALAGCDRPGTRCTAWSSDNRCVKTSSR